MLYIIYFYTVINEIAGEMSNANNLRWLFEQEPIKRLQELPLSIIKPLQ